jgi:hypothetical protein
MAMLRPTAAFAVGKLIESGVQKPLDELNDLPIDIACTVFHCLSAARCAGDRRS